MERKQSSRPLPVVLLIILLILLGLGGFGGGIPMLIDPSGASIGLPADLVENSPVNSFFLPGLFLIGVMGVVPLVIAYGLWCGQRWAWLASLGQGAVLVLWIIYQIYLWGDPIFIQYLYLVWGSVLFGLGWLPQTRREFSA